MNKQLKIKVCGMRELANIEALAQLKIDYMGMIFYPKSKRYVTALTTIELPKSIQKIAVFVDEDLTLVKNTAVKFNLTMLQLHGYESPEYCAVLQQANYTVIKVFHVNSDFDFAQTKAYEGVCDYFLFDTKGKELGGNGIQFNWQCLANYKGTVPFFLSGGIALANVKDLKEFEHPQLYGIDINSQFEDAPALKNIPKIQQFLTQLL